MAWNAIYWSVCFLGSNLNNHAKLQKLRLSKDTGLFKMIVGVLTTCHTQYTWDSSICIFLFNRTTLQIFVTYLIGALYAHPLWFYRHQHDNRVHSKLFVACQRWWFQWRFWFVPMWFLSMGLHQGSGLCSSSSRKYPGTEGTNQNRHRHHHRWHATDSLERTRLSCWCL